MIDNQFTREALIAMRCIRQLVSMILATTKVTFCSYQCNWLGTRDTLRDILLSPKQESLQFDLLAETVALSASARSIAGSQFSLARVLPSIMLCLSAYIYFLYGFAGYVRS